MEHSCESFYKGEDKKRDGKERKEREAGGEPMTESGR